MNRRCFGFGCARQCRTLEYGHYCISCFRLATDKGNKEFLDEEVVARDAKLDVHVDLCGPAVTNLLITPIVGEGLPKYKRCAEFISSVHCRLCLADCNALEPLDSYPQRSATADLRSARSPCVASTDDRSPMYPAASGSCSVPSSVDELSAVRPSGSTSPSGSDPVPDAAKGRLPGIHLRGSSKDVAAPGVVGAAQEMVPMGKYNWGVDFRVARHALEHHDMNPAQYCREVFGRALAEGLQPVTPQVCTGGPFSSNG